jgi:hypothetical protein
MLKTTRTYRAKIVNHQQVSNDFDDCGFSAFKPWNVVRSTTGKFPTTANSKNMNDTDTDTDTATSILTQVRSKDEVFVFRDASVTQ